MELIYYWMSTTNQKTIRTPQGINLSPLYDFYVECEEDKCILCKNEIRDAHNIFNTKNIRNLTILVGENGAGKTTILKSILSHAEQIHDKYGDGLKDFGVVPYSNEHICGSGEPIKYIIIFETNKVLHVFSSVKYLDCSKIKDVQIIIHNIGNRNKLELYNSNEIPFQDTTIIYLTNSIYSSNTREMSYFEKVHSISLTPNTLQDIGSKYYRNLYGNSDSLPYKRRQNPHMAWRQILQSSTKDNELQDLLYILNQHRLFNDDSISENKCKKIVSFSVHMLKAPSVFRKHLFDADTSSYFLNGWAFANIFIVIMELEREWNNFLPSEDLFLRIVYINIVCELMIVKLPKKEGFDEADDRFIEAYGYAVNYLSNGIYRLDRAKDGKYNIKAAENVSTDIQIPKEYYNMFWPFDGIIQEPKKIDKWITDMCALISDEDSFGDSNYYLRALDEINEFLNATKSTRDGNKDNWNKQLKDDCNAKDFFNFLTNNEVFMDFVYEKDSSNNEWDNNKEYKRILKAIDGFSNNKYSFILRYLKIETNGMSSGEKSYLNFFSWLCEVPLMIDKIDRYTNKHNVSTDTIQGMEDELLFLFDEPDLYLHPQWQKNLISELLEEIAIRYHDKKIQIIMTTSSPLTLSDVPVGNTVYLRRDDVGTVVEHRRQNQTEQTFGSDIYRLFNKSFFLNGSPMGSFAEKYINDEILQPLNEMRLAVWNAKVVATTDGDKTRYVEPNKSDYNEKLQDIKWRIELIANDILYQKARQMYDEIMEWSEE